MPRLQGAIFDLDGLLVDSEGLKYRSIGEVLREYGTELFEDEFIERWIGRGYGFREGLERHGLADSFDEIRAKQNAVYLALIRDELELMPGAMDALEGLRARGMKLGLATGSRREFRDATVEKFNLMEYLDVAVSGEEVAENKPAPDIYIKAAGGLGCEPRRCVAFEDAEGGVLAAKAAGLLCVAVPNRYTAGMDLSAADLRIPDLGGAVRAVEELEGGR